MSRVVVQNQMKRLRPKVDHHAKQGIFRSSWSLTRRVVVSALLLAYLFLVVMGPISNPIATEELTGPIARNIAPLHEALYLGHGYRFFAPDPGPSHLVVYRVTLDDGSVIEGQIPDVDEHWPRLLYHRWFMLSETIWNEHAATPDEQSFAAIQQELSVQADRFRQANKPRFAEHMEKLRTRQLRLYRQAQERITALDRALALEILQRHNGVKVELFCRERAIALPADVVLGRKPNHEGYLGELRKVAEVER